MKIGLKKLTEKQKEILREMVEFTCEGCFEHQDKVGKIQPHRIIRKHQGGRYIPRNIKMLCDDCHKQMHGGEFKHISG